MPKQLGTDERYSKADNTDILEEKEHNPNGEVETEELGQSEFKRKSNKSPRAE